MSFSFGHVRQTIASQRVQVLPPLTKCSKQHCHIARLDFATLTLGIDQHFFADQFVFHPSGDGLRLASHRLLRAQVFPLATFFVLCDKAEFHALCAGAGVSIRLRLEGVIRGLKTRLLGNQASEQTIDRREDRGMASEVGRERQRHPPLADDPLGDLLKRLNVRPPECKDGLFRVADNKQFSGLQVHLLPSACRVLQPLG